MFKKQITAIVLVLAVLVSMVPVGIFAVDEEIGYGTVESISEGITFRNDVQTGAVVDATFAGTLQKTTAPIEDGEAWWVGIKLNAPENYDPEKATYTIGGDTKSFEENKDGENYIELWGKVTPAYMQAACQDDGLSTYRWEFDWDGEGTHTQVIILNIDPYNTVLEEGEHVVYAYTGGQVDAFTEGVTFTNGVQTGPVVEANYKGTLQWIQGNEIRQDGWWVGIKMTAPEFYNAEQATYNGKLFKDNKDGENHIELWGLVTPEYMQAACQDDGLSTYTWKFSWDNNGETIEQTVILNIDPYNTVLEKDTQTEYAYKNGSVESLTHDITYKDDLQTGSVVEATFAGTLQKTTVPNEEGESWRVGIKVTAPEFYNAEQATCNGNLFKDGKTGENDIELWGEVTPEALNAARQDNGLSTYTWKFSWDNNGETIEQTVILNIDAEKTVLMDGALKYYPAGLGNVNCYTGTDVVIDGNETDHVTVTVNKVTLTWSPADESIGRTAGWWVGIGVTAPENLTEEDLKKTVYQSKNNPGAEWPTETKSFWTNKDSKAAPHYIQLWFPVNPTTLEKFQNEDRMMTMCYRFDWDGNSEYDQSITFNLNTKSDNKENIKLAMDGTEPEIVFEKAYVDTDGNTKVFFNATSVHGVSIVEVNGESQAVTTGAYEVTLSGELQNVTVKVTDIYGNITDDDMAVQPKLTVSLTASEAVNTVGKNHYYNENQKLSFAYITNVDSVDPKSPYAIKEVVLTDASGNPVNWQAITEGVLTNVKVTVTDASGRKAEAVLSGNYIYDTTAPKVTVTAENENVTGFYSNGDRVYAILKDPVKVKKGATETVSFKVTVEDANLDPALYEGWEIEGTTATKIFSTQVAKHYTGMVSLDFTAIDLADNKGSETLISLGEGNPTWKLEPENGKYRLDIHVDRNAPGTDGDGMPQIQHNIEDNVIYAENFNIEIQLQDNGAGIKSVIYNLEDAGGAVSQIAAVPELKNGRYVIPVEILENTESDRVWLTLTVTDNVGNIFEYHLNFSVDKKAPGIELIEGDVNKGDEIAYYQNGATFLFSVGEMSEYTLEWELDDTVDGNFLELTTDKEYATVTIKDGAVNEVEATLKLTATDVHGHVSKTYEIFFVVDNKAPEVTVTMDAEAYVQTQNGVDYFNGEVPYTIQIKDKYLANGSYTLYYDWQEVTQEFVGDTGIFSDSFTVGSEKDEILEKIQLVVSDMVGNRPNEVTVDVANSENVVLSFDKTQTMNSNKVVVDTTAPEVTVTVDAAKYEQSVNGVDYFDGNVEYTITVSDQFMEEDTYELEVQAIYEDGQETVPFEKVYGEKLGDVDTFTGKIEVTDGKVLKDIQIRVLDAAKREPEKIEAIVTGNDNVVLTFAKNNDGVFACTSNDVVVDMTAPEVTVTTNAMNYVQTVTQKNGELVDYFSQELTYGIEITDKFMEEGTYQLKVLAIYADNTSEEINFKRDGEGTEETGTTAVEIGATDTFFGEFTVTDGKVLTDIKINVLDAAHNNPDEVKTVVAMADGAFLSFKENTENGIFECDSNDVVVDMTAPEVTVTTNAMNYVQTVKYENGELVDYFNQELTYGIEVTDKFMDEGYQLEVKAIYKISEDAEQEVSVELARVDGTADTIGDTDTFFGYITVTDVNPLNEDNKPKFNVLTDIKINILDAAHNNPDEVKTVVAMADGAFLSFKENTENGIFECDSNDVCVDTTAPSVEIKFSDNVEKFYQREDGNEKNHYLLVTPVEGAGGNTPSKGTDPVNVTVTVTVKDKNIIMADEGVVSDYYIEKLLRNDNETFDVITYQKIGEDTVVYTATVTVEYDKIVKLPFKLNIVDFAGNKPEEKDVTLNSEKQNGLTLENFAQPENGIVGDTVIIDRRRSTSEDRQIPDLTLRPDAAVATLPDGTPLYDANFKVMLDVKDIDHPDNSAAGVNPSAGIQMIEWKIEDVNNVAEMDKETKFNTATLSTQDYFDVVTNGENESNEGKLYVTVTDNAGNMVTKLYSFGLDNMSPRVNVAYDDPAGITPYFRETRTATITVEDLNFNADTTTVYVKQGQRRDVTWMSAGNNRYVGRVAYAEEGDYEFSLTTTDLATNNTATDKNNVSVPTGKVTFTSGITGDQAFHVFTIDKTAPVISVVYNPAKPVDVDGDGVEYFDENRVAEVTITDTNFTAATTTVTGGEQGWVHPYRGMDNQYSATFGEGNNYVVEAASTDKAGNVAVPYKGTPFSVDLTDPEINITAGMMTNKQLNIVQDDLVLGFTITDTNSNLKSCVVTMQHINGMLETVTVSGAEYYTERDVSDRTTRYVDITNIAKEKANDGIYSIQITATDYAGRTVNLTPELYMSLNRFGSSFYITDPDTKAFFTGVNGETIYHNEVTKNLIIQEINPNNVWQNAEEKTEEGALITLAFNGNANELEKGVDYSVEHTENGSGSNTWHMYTYEIFKDNFYSNGELVDGRYKLLIYSEDDAGNKNGNESNVDSQLMSYEDGTTAGMVEFVLDHKKPVVSLIGAEDEETISENNKIVEISISDNAAVAVTAYIDGQAIAITEYTENMPLDQTWFTYNKETGKYMLNITQSNSRQDIKVVVTDAAGNETVYEVNGVLVTKNIFVQYINSVPALCITAVVLIAALVLVLFLKKRKKEKGAEK